MPFTPLTLTGSIVRLEPLRRSHGSDLARVGLHPELWTLQPKAIATPADMQAYVDLALDEQLRGVSLPFVIVHPATHTVIGSTRFMDIALPHRRLEIGATWLTPSLQRTGANVETKLLLLTHAFEVLSIRKVVLKTETLNVQSRKAILAIGAVEEGTFRQHLLAEDGRARDMVYFSVLSSEWPAVKSRLEARLRRHAPGSHATRVGRL
jgi:RimJ/RimL family protein N-acetyltransferase